MDITLGRRRAGLIERIDKFGVRHCVVSGVNGPDPQNGFNRYTTCQNARMDVMWPDVEIGRTWDYKCGSCDAVYYCKDVKVKADACARCGGDWMEPNWNARKRLQNMLDSRLNSNGERMKDIGELLTQNLLDTGEAYLVRSGKYHTDESGNVSEEPAELNEPEPRMGMQGTLNYWVPAGPGTQFVKTVNEWQHLLGLPSSVVFCVYHRSKAYVGMSACPECDAQMIDACGYIRAPVSGGGRAPNDANLEYFGEREVLGYGGWHCQIEVGAGHKTDNYKHLSNYSHIDVDVVNSIRTLLNEKFFGPLAESIVGRDTGFTLEVPLAVDESQRHQDKSKVLDAVTQYAKKGYHHQLLPDGVFMVAAPSGEPDNSA